MADRGLTIQSNILNTDDKDMTKYALFAGGVDVTNPVLHQYSPYRGGFYRLFMIRQPVFMTELFGKKMRNFKHVLEYGNTGVSGLGDISVGSNSMQGGYVGRSVNVPTIATDDTTSFTVTTYEFDGLPMREMLWAWINGTMDTQTGLTHYFGLIEEYMTSNGTKGLPKSLANETAEFIYGVTDQTGWNVQYACHLANCFPMNLPNDMFNGRTGDHQLGELSIQFNCVKYESPQINEVAKALLNKYRILMNVMDFNCKFDQVSGVSGLNPENKVIRYNPETGELESADSNRKYKTYTDYYLTGNNAYAPTPVAHEIQIPSSSNTMTGGAPSGLGTYTNGRAVAY